MGETWLTSNTWIVTLSWWVPDSVGFLEPSFLSLTGSTTQSCSMQIPLAKGQELVISDFISNPHFFMLGSYTPSKTLFFFFSFIFISWRLVTSQHFSGFCHTSTWISHSFQKFPGKVIFKLHLSRCFSSLKCLSTPSQSTCIDFEGAFGILTAFQL